MGHNENCPSLLEPQKNVTGLPSQSKSIKPPKISLDAQAVSPRLTLSQGCGPNAGSMQKKPSVLEKNPGYIEGSLFTSNSKSPRPVGAPILSPNGVRRSIGSK